MKNKTKKEGTFYYKGEECAVTSEPYTLFGGECIDAVSIETGKELTVATKVLLRHGVNLNMKDQKYNGWTNYATWRVALEIFDGNPEGWEEITKRECIDYAVEVVSDGADGFALDYALAFLNTVNWQEIADHINDNARDSYRYRPLAVEV